MLSFEGVYELHWIASYAVCDSGLLRSQEIEASRYFLCVADGAGWHALQGCLSALAAVLEFPEIPVDVDKSVSPVGLGGCI